MAVRRIGRVGRIARVSKGGVVLGAHDILTITDNGGGALLVTTASLHGLGEGPISITISGASDYNGVHNTPVGDPASATTFVLETSYSADATGGRWDLT